MSLGLPTIGTHLLLSFAVLIAWTAHAASLTSRSSACFLEPEPTTCESSPLRSGAGAATDIIRTIDRITPGRSFHAQASAGMTVFDYGHFAARAGGSGDIVWENPLGLVNYSIGRATATFEDTITAVGGSGGGSLRLLWQITGVNDIGWVASPRAIDVAGRVSLDFTCATSIHQLAFNCGNPSLPWDVPSFSWDSSGTINQVVAITFPIVFGTPIDTFLGIDLTATAGFSAENCEGCTTFFQGHANGNFGSTGKLIDVQLLDGAGNMLDKRGIQSESGFRYDLVGQPVGEPVPEPMTLAMTLLGVLAIFVARIFSATARSYFTRPFKRAI